MQKLKIILRFRDGDFTYNGISESELYFICEWDNGIIEKSEKVSQFIKDGLQYKVLSNGSDVSIIGYKGTATKLNLPSKVVYCGTQYKVVSIGNEAFKGNKTLKTIIIKSNYKIKVGKNPFWGINTKATCKISGKQKKANAKKLKSCKINKYYKLKVK